MTWKNISLFKYQQIEQINSNKNYDDLEKVLLTAVVLFNLTEQYIIDMGAAFAARLIRRVNKIFAIPFKSDLSQRIGKYNIGYNVPDFTFGQYVELAFFFQRPGQHAHYILASCARRRFRRYESESHKARAEYFLFAPCQKAIGAVEVIRINLEAFNAGFSHLFGLDEEVHTRKAQSDKFNNRYGWTYSASAIAEYCRIPLNDVYAMPAKEALNHLAYLKEKAQYEIRERDRLIKQYKLEQHAG